MSILNVNTIQPIGSGTTVTVAATELKTSNFITVGTGASVTSPSANVLTLGTNTAERLRITSAGYLGLGTNNPSYLVDAHTSSGNAQLRLKSGGDLAQLILESTDTSGYSQINFADAGSNNIGMLQYFHSDNHMEFTVNGTEALRIDSSGRLLLGTTTPGHAFADNLTISDSGNCGITLISGTSNYGTLYFGDSGGNNRGQVEYSHSADSLHFYTAEAEKLRIKSDGQININASSESIGGRVLIKHNVDYTTTDFDDSPTLYLLNDDRTTGVSEAAVVFAGRNSAGSTFRAAISGNGSTGLKFYTTNNAESDETPAMIIDGSGHVKRPTMAAAAVTLSTGLTTLSTFNGSYQSLAIDSEGFDNANNYNTTNYRFTAPETGFYQVGCNVQLEGGVAANTNSWMYLYPTINGNAPGTSVGGNQADFDPRDTHYYSFTYTTLLKLSQNDYVQWKYTGNLSSIKLKGQGESIFYFYQVG